MCDVACDSDYCTLGRSGIWEEAEKVECIYGPALRNADNDIYADPIPASHWSVSQNVKELHHDNTLTPLTWEQGFLTNTGRFVDRDEGFKIAQSAGQIPPTWKPRHLFSEDLW